MVLVLATLIHAFDKRLFDKGLENDKIVKSII
jgi:hypothetical protein